MDKGYATGVWILFANYALAAFPGISYIVYNAHIKNVSNDKRPTLMSYEIWFHSIFVLMTVSQIVLYNRLMGIRMIRSFLFGQLVSLLLVMLCLNDNVLNKLETLPIGQLYTFVSMCACALFIAYVGSGVSELSIID